MQRYVLRIISVVHCYSTGQHSHLMNPNLGSQAYFIIIFRTMATVMGSGWMCHLGVRCSIHRHRPLQIITADKTLHLPVLSPVSGTLPSFRQPAAVQLISGYMNPNRLAAVHRPVHVPVRHTCRSFIALPPLPPSRPAAGPPTGRPRNRSRRQKYSLTY